MENRALKLTPSLIDVFESCPRRYWYLYEPDSPQVPRRISWQLSFGTSLHEAMKEIYFLGGPPQVPLSSLSQILEKCWHREGFTDESLERERKLRALEILENYIEGNRSRPVMTLGLEKQLSASIEGVNFLAKIDRLDLLRPGLLIVDYKTGQGALSDNQLLISFLVVLFNYKSPSDRPVKFMLLNLERGEEKIIDLEEEKAFARISHYKNIRDQIIQREFPPNPSVFTCRYCEAGNICSFARKWERE
ncbi:MAG: PD-(D/E)XK nuclease family protein [Caldiserica bacterium]|jgi:RecB family exonuclease|nr:PD-(D/E)XK nuclease family protein [Caldisericota bacterium]MDH7562453.1 PD-(D/E)XK nuclease family protein [Caldisericota bacterium]